MQTNFSGDSTPNFDKKPAAENVNDGLHALSFEQLRDSFIKRVAGIAQFAGTGDNSRTFHEIGQPDAPHRIFLDVITIGTGANGNSSGGRKH